MYSIQVKIVNTKIGTDIPMPEYSTSGSAGLDLRACIESDMTVAPGQTIMIPTGISVYIKDPKLAGLVLPRSGLGHKHGIVLGNLIGLIDSDYQGELMISCWNRSDKAYKIEPAARLAQLMIVPVVQAQFEVVKEFTKTNRGEDGWGSTGEK